MTALQFHPNIPESCPPSEAQPANNVIFRAVDSWPPKPKHFLSDVESQKKNSDDSKCDCWGMSVWITEAAALHGRKLFSFVRKGYIAKGPVGPTDGLIMATASERQPGHNTFWKVHQLDISARFSQLVGPKV